MLLRVVWWKWIMKGLRSSAEIYLRRSTVDPEDLRRQSDQVDLDKLCLLKEI